MAHRPNAGMSFVICEAVILYFVWNEFHHLLPSKRFWPECLRTRLVNMCHYRKIGQSRSMHELFGFGMSVRRFEQVSAVRLFCHYRRQFYTFPRRSLNMLTLSKHVCKRIVHFGFRLTILAHHRSYDTEERESEKCALSICHLIYNIVEHRKPVTVDLRFPRWGHTVHATKHGMTDFSLGN